MATFADVCPHCSTSIALDIIGSHPTALGNTALYCMCSNCRMPSIFLVSFTTSSVERAIAESGTKAVNRFVSSFWHSYPEGGASSCPEYVPDDVARVFMQARDAHKRASLDLAAMGYRRALEVALKAIAPDLKGQLGPRIDQLAKQHVLTPAMKEWADDTRILGNEATHDPPEPSAENVEQLFLFVESLLEYLFTLPERVRLRRAGEAS
jgi:hypothetical protein